MNEPRNGASEEPSGEAPVVVEAAAPEPVPARRRPYGVVGGLAGVLVVIIVGVLTAPLWAPAVVPLLPWGAADHDRPLADRVAALEQHVAAPDPAAGRDRARLDALSAQVARLQTAPAGGAAEAAVQKLDQRVAAVETRLAARPAVDPATIAKLQQGDTRLDAATEDLGKRLDATTADLGNRLGAATADLGKRLGALEQQVKAQAGADRTAAGLVLAFLQIREAADAGRPFTAAYAAFSTLAHGRPKIIAAATPLAAAAPGGVPGRAALAQQLAALTRTIATASPPATGKGWQAQALARLRGLVTIRRIGDTASTSPGAVATRAQQGLAQGDLAGAVADLGGLTGDAAAAARPWLQAARQRLDLEKSLDALESLLVAGLGSPSPPAPAGAATPAGPPGSRS